MTKAGRVLNNIGKAIVLGDEDPKPGSDVCGEEPLLHAGPLDLSVLSDRWQIQSLQLYTFWAII